MEKEQIRVQQIRVVGAGVRLQFELSGSSSLIEKVITEVAEEGDHLGILEKGDQPVQ
jgi:hypothetical protein